MNYNYLDQRLHADAARLAQVCLRNYNGSWREFANSLAEKTRDRNRAPKEVAKIGRDLGIVSLIESHENPNPL